MIICRTPFRISFFGGGTDYPEYFKNYPGATLVTTIDKYCYLTCRYLPPFFEHKSRIVYSKMETLASNELVEHPAIRETLKHLNLTEGLEIHHDADLPARTGLGSSSAFTVGLLNSLYNLKHSPQSKLFYEQQAIYVERELCKENVGYQDQISTCRGGLNHIEFFYKDNRYQYEISKINICNERKQELQSYLMLYYTGLSRIASTIAKHQISNIAKRKKQLKQMYNMVGKATKLLENGDLVEFGNMLHDSWQLKKSLSDKISTKDIDIYYERARKAGAIGGKLLGAGGGGFLLLFADPIAQNKIKEELKDLLLVPFKFEETGTQIIFNNGNL